MLNIVMVPFHDYKKWLKEGFRTRDAHVCEHFSRNPEVGKILVINRPTSFAETLLKKGKWYITSYKIEYINNHAQLAQVEKNVWCLDFFLPDFLKVAFQKKKWWFTAFNYQKVIDSITEAVDYLDMKDSILLLQNPMAIGSAKNLKCKKFVFDAIDNWLYHPQMTDKKLIGENYKYVDDHANLIMTVSKVLIDTFPINENKHWVPNGVDVDYFSQAIKEETSDLKTVCYIGKIQDRVDFELVEKCLIALPDVKFVFLGPIYSQTKKIKCLMHSYKNIEFKGDVHYSDLPKEMKSFDVAIIPHKVDEFTNSMNPLKLYEYLAGGKPVVATGVAGTESISQYVRTASSSEEFVTELKELLQNRNQIDTMSVVKSVPEDCTWRNRTNVMIELIKQL